MGLSMTLVVKNWCKQYRGNVGSRIGVATARMAVGCRRCGALEQDYAQSMKQIKCKEFLEVGGTNNKSRQVKY